MSEKAERFPRRLVKRLTDEQRRALDELPAAGFHSFGELNAWLEEHAT